MKNLLLFFLISSSFHTFSQIVRGYILDSQNVKVSGAIIRVKDTNDGTTANTDGFYQLELKNGKYILIFSSFGYETITDSIEINESDIELNVTLEKITKETDEVVIENMSALEKGKQIMKKVIRKRPYYQDLLKEYSCDTYCFGSLERDLMDSLKRDSVVGKENLKMLEWSSRSYYQAPERYKDEFIVYEDFEKDFENLFYIDHSGGVIDEIGENSKSFRFATAEDPHDLFVSGIKQAHFSILDNTIDIPALTKTPLISPLAYNAMIYYKFYFERSFYDSSNQVVYEITVKPRFKYEASFEGTLFIRDESWEIVSYDLKVNPKVLVNFKDVRIICDYKKDGEHLIPVRKEFDYTIKRGKRDICGLIRLVQSDYSYSPLEKSFKFWEQQAVFIDDALDKNLIDLNQTRQFPLKEYELKFIKEKDSTINYYESDEYLREHDSIENRFRPLKYLLSDYEHINSLKKQGFRINGLMWQCIPFGVGGYRHNLIVDYNKEFKNGKKIVISPNLDYGVDNQDLMGTFNGWIMYNRLNLASLGFDIGKAYDLINSSQNIQGTIAPANRVFNQKLELWYSRELINGLNVKSTFHYSDRKPIDNLEYPDWVQVFGGFQTPQSFDRYKIFLTTFEFEYCFRQRYKIKNNIKHTYSSVWPKLKLTYKKALPNIFAAEANFDFIEFRISDKIELNSFGYSEINFKAGGFLQKKDLRLIEYKSFRQSDLFYFSDPSNSLQLLDTSIYTENSYMELHFVHFFQGFFLNKMPALNHLRLEEIVGGSMLTIPDAHFFQAELYIGMRRTIKLLDEEFTLGVYAVTQVNTISGASFHWKFDVFDLF